MALYDDLFITAGGDPSLEAWWKFDDNVASTVVADSTAASLDATLVGGNNTADLTTTGSGSTFTAALDLDGTADYINLGDNAATEIGAGDWTLLMRFNVDDLLEIRPLYAKWNSGTNNRSLLVRLGTDGRLDVLSSNDGTFTTPTQSYSARAIGTGSWHTLAIVHDSTSDITVIYLDGAKEVRSAGAIFSGNEPATIGGYSTSFFDGKICDVSFFSRVLTEEEVHAWHTVEGDSLRDGNSPKLIQRNALETTGSVARNISFSTAATVGNTIHIWGWQGEDAIGFSVTDDGGNTYTQEFESSPVAGYSFFHYSAPVTSAATTVTITPSPLDVDVLHISIAEFSGDHTVSNTQLDAIASGDDGGARLPGTGVAVSQDSTLLGLSATFSTSSDPRHTMPDGWEDFGTFNNQKCKMGCLEDRVAGTYAMSGTWRASVSGYVYLATLEYSAAPPPGGDNPIAQLLNKPFGFASGRPGTCES